jgi:hypothetical protein
MIRLFQSVINRVKAMFTLDAMLDLEQQFLTRQAERRADLIREADRYQREGLTAVADDLRRQAVALSEQRPLQAVLPFLDAEAEVRPSSAPRAIGSSHGDRRDARQIAHFGTGSSTKKKGRR